MASPIPCGVCGVAPDADFLITSRNPAFQVGDQSTIGICSECLMKLGLAMLQASEDAEAEPAPAIDREKAPDLMAALEKSLGMEPADEKPARKSRAKPEERGASELHEEETPAHVHG